MSRVNLKTGKKPKGEPKVASLEYADLEDEFSEFKAMGLQEKVETEKLSKYLVDETDIEGKSFVDNGEKILFTLVSIMAQYPKFAPFRLERFPKIWLHYALGEQGRGRLGVLEVLRGNVQIGAPKMDQMPMDRGRLR